MAFDTDTLKWASAAYILTVSAVSFYIIFLSSQVQQRLGSVEWVNQKNLANTGDLTLFIQFKNTSYNFAIALVVINFFIMTFLIFSKYKLGTRS